MDFREKADRPNPREKANPISKLFFWWMFPLFNTGYKRDLTMDDMYNTMYEDLSERLGDRLAKAWDKEIVKAKASGGKPKFYKAMISVFGSHFIFLSLFYAIDEWIIRVAQTLYLKWLIESFSLTNTDPDRVLKQYLYAAGVCGTTLFHTLAHWHEVPNRIFFNDLPQVPSAQQVNSEQNHDWSNGKSFIK